MSRDGEPDKIYLDPKTYKAFLKLLNQKSKSFKNINRSGVDESYCSSPSLEEIKKYLKISKKHDIDSAVKQLGISHTSGINYEILRN